MLFGGGTKNLPKSIPLWVLVGIYSIISMNINETSTPGRPLLRNVKNKCGFAWLAFTIKHFLPTLPACESRNAAVGYQEMVCVRFFVKKSIYYDILCQVAL